MEHLDIDIDIDILGFIEYTMYMSDMPAHDGGRHWGLTVPQGVVLAALVGREVRPRRSRSAVGRSDRARGGGGQLAGSRSAQG